MKYSTVTLGYEDIEWISPRDVLKDAIWDDTEFAVWVADRDILDALETVSGFHRVVGNQLARAGITEQPWSEWAGRAVCVAIQLKKRRQQLRYTARMEHGHDVVAKLIRDFDIAHPKTKNKAVA